MPESRDPICWFSFDAGLGLTVISGSGAFAAFEDGWHPVNSAEVEWDGRALSEADASTGFRNTLAGFGEPPMDLKPVDGVSPLPTS